MRIRQSTTPTPIKSTQTQTAQKTKSTGSTTSGRTIAVATSPPARRASDFFQAATKKITQPISSLLGKVSKTIVNKTSQVAAKVHTIATSTVARSRNTTGTEKSSRRDEPPAVPPRASISTPAQTASTAPHTSTHKPPRTTATATQVAVNASAKSPALSALGKLDLSNIKTQLRSGLKIAKQQVRQSISTVKQHVGEVAQRTGEAIHKVGSAVRRAETAATGAIQQAATQAVHTTQRIAQDTAQFGKAALNQVESTTFGLTDAKGLPSLVADGISLGKELNVLRQKGGFLRNIQDNGKTFIGVKGHNPWNLAPGRYSSGSSFAKNAAKSALKSEYASGWKNVSKNLGKTAALSVAGTALDYWAKDQKILSKDFAVDAAVDFGVGLVSGAAAKASGAAIGAAVGTLIPIPIVGTVVGAAVGAAVGIGVSKVINYGFDKLNVQDKIKGWFK
jgi:hypothetical protein